MSMHKIEVDEEVFNYLQSKGRAFVDTPNMVLRRLFLGGDNSSSSSIDNLLPELPASVPKALSEILEVACLVRGEGYSRTTATDIVARYHQVKKQTVIDKYTRQLGLTASEFDRFLAEDNPSKLRSYLNNKFAGYENLIEKHL